MILGRTLREFEIEVDPAPGQIAIGFSSQYRFRKGVNGLGGTRGPLNSHILLRESAPTIVEPERLEALVHELGHFLGRGPLSPAYVGDAAGHWGWTGAVEVLSHQL